MWGLDDYIKYNKQDNFITFNNGSEVLLMDIYLYPQDPDFVKLGSLELTGAVIDEAAESSERAFDILNSRFRYKLNEYKLIPKLLIVSNPTKNYLYRLFYKPYKENSLPDYRKFVQSLPTDNHYLPEAYLENLRRLPELDKRRLYYGEWDFIEDDFNLFNREMLLNCFYNKISPINNRKYITCDPASTGMDRTVITYWEGYSCKEIKTFERIDTLKIVNEIRTLMNRTGTPINKVIVDGTGVGVGVVDTLKGCKSFIANSKPFKNENFMNLKSQVFFKFADLVNNGDVSIEVNSGDIEEIMLELELHKKYKADQDGKAKVTPKELIRHSLGRSPDIADALMMRFYFEFSTEFSFTFL